MRNALAYAPAKSRTPVAAMLTTIFAQETKADAMVQWDTVADALRDKPPKLGALLDTSREDVLADMDLPREHGPPIASTTPASARTGKSSAAPTWWAFGRWPSLPNNDAAIRLIGALMLGTNDNGRWPGAT